MKYSFEQPKQILKLVTPVIFKKIFMLKIFLHLYLLSLLSTGLTKEDPSWHN